MTETTISVAEAGRNLPWLLARAAGGEKIVILSDGGDAFLLTTMPRAPLPTFGSARGLVEIAADFDDPLPGFEAYRP